MARRRSKSAEGYQEGVGSVGVVVLSKRGASWGSEFHENAFSGGERDCCDLGDSLHIGSSRNDKKEVDEH
jgi:hypothetical protein